MPSLTVTLSKEELSLLKERGKENFLTSKEQAEDILRRSLLSYQRRKSNKLPSIKIDDKLVAAFSRDPRGRKKKT